MTPSPFKNETAISIKVDFPVVKSTIVILVALTVYLFKCSYIVLSKDIPPICINILPDEAEALTAKKY